MSLASTTAAARLLRAADRVLHHGCQGPRAPHDEGPDDKGPERRGRLRHRALRHHRRGQGTRRGGAAQYTAALLPGRRHGRAHRRPSGHSSQHPSPSRADPCCRAPTRLTKCASRGNAWSAPQLRSRRAVARHRATRPLTLPTFYSIGQVRGGDAHPCGHVRAQVPGAHFRDGPRRHEAGCSSRWQRVLPRVLLRQTGRALLVQHVAFVMPSSHLSIMLRLGADSSPQ